MAAMSQNMRMKYTGFLSGSLRFLHIKTINQDINLIFSLTLVEFIVQKLLRFLYFH